MKSRLFLLSTIAAAVLTGGCTVYSNSTLVQGFDAFRFENLQKGTDYEVLGDAQGQYCWEYGFGAVRTSWKAGVTYPANSPKDPDETLPLAHRDAINARKQPHAGAMHAALEAFKNADFILPLRWKSDDKNYFFFDRTCETVSGKAIRLKV